MRDEEMNQDDRRELQRNLLLLLKMLRKKPLDEQMDAEACGDEDIQGFEFPQDGLGLLGHIRRNLNPKMRARHIRMLLHLAQLYGLSNKVLDWNLKYTPKLWGKKWDRYRLEEWGWSEDDVRSSSTSCGKNHSMVASAGLNLNPSGSSFVDVEVVLASIAGEYVEPDMPIFPPIENEPDGFTRIVDVGGVPYLEYFNYSRKYRENPNIKPLKPVNMRKLAQNSLVIRDRKLGN